MTLDRSPKQVYDGNGVLPYHIRQKLYDMRNKRLEVPTPEVVVEDPLVIAQREVKALALAITSITGEANSEYLEQGRLRDGLAALQTRLQENLNLSRPAAQQSRVENFVFLITVPILFLSSILVIGIWESFVLLIAVVFSALCQPYKQMSPVRKEAFIDRLIRFIRGFSIWNHIATIVIVYTVFRYNLYFSLVGIVIVVCWSMICFTKHLFFSVDYLVFSFEYKFLEREINSTQRAIESSQRSYEQIIISRQLEYSVQTFINEVNKCNEEDRNTLQIGPFSLATIRVLETAFGYNPFPNNPFPRNPDGGNNLLETEQTNPDVIEEGEDFFTNPMDRQIRMDESEI